LQAHLLQCHRTVVVNGQAITVAIKILSLQSDEGFGESFFPLARPPGQFTDGLASSS
jgi:hypothetical protein